MASANHSTQKGSAVETIQKQMPNCPGLVSEGTAWATPGQAAYNFLSDTATSGTPAMLDAIVRATLLDDVFAEDPTTNDLESYVASLFGYPSALLVLSGTMGNQLALRTHLTNPPHSVVADVRSHVIVYEAGGVATLSQGMTYPVTPSNGRYVTLEDVKTKCVLDDDIHHCPTRVISLENTIGGAIMPLDECRRIASFAREKGVRMHLDGARIWEAVAAQVAEGKHGGDYVKGLKAYAECFDSIQTCFSKGLGAPIGSILLGSPEFIKKARHHRKAIGGGIRAAGIIAGPARVAVDETFLAGKLAATHVLAKRIACMWEENGGKLQQPVETNMIWLDLPGSGVDATAWVEAGKEEGIRLRGGRVVCHYQLCEDAVERLGRVVEKTLANRNAATNGAIHRPSNMYQQ